MRIGFALPQYDYSVAGESPLSWPTLLDYARRAANLGFDSLWLSDHLFLDLAKYGGSDARYGAFDAITTLGALARAVPGPRLGTMVMCEALRPPGLLAKALSTLDRLSDGRLDVGLGAGWYEPEYEIVGMTLPPPRVRLERLAETVEIVLGLLKRDGAPVTVSGRHHHVTGAQNRPTPVQSPHPPVFVGGKGDRLLDLVARLGAGWNTCWVWTHDAYRERVDVLHRACAAHDRDPATITRSLGLYALCGEDPADLERRFDRMKAGTPAGILDSVTLDAWRPGRLVGTVGEVRDQARRWEELGVETLIVGAGAVPFAVGAPDDLDLLAHALGLSGPARLRGGSTP